MRRPFGVPGEPLLWALGSVDKAEMLAAVILGKAIISGLRSGH